MPHYTLRSELARICLTAYDPDRNRTLAWVNSICALFLVVGLVGVWPSHPFAAPALRTVIVPIVFTPLEPSAPAPHRPPATAPALVSVAPAPAVVTVVAALTPEVAFAVPFAEPVILAPTRYAESPPVRTSNAPPSAPTQFTPDQGDRSTPSPEYPRLALQRGYQGRVVIQFEVNERGEIARAEVERSSGYVMLDEAALNTVRTRWRFAPGAVRRHFVEIVFQLQ